MPHPFRFGVQLSSLPAAGWVDRVRRIEALGYSTVFWPDHFGRQWDPVVALSAAAAVTDRLRVGSLVYGVDYRHPVVFAKAAATIQLLSNGRHEFGLGAGWMQTDYDEAGIPCDRPGVRIARLDEALTVIRSLWREEKSSFRGAHYMITDAPRALPLGDVPPPKVLVGGGGPKVLAIAGKHADIVGINPSLPEGRILPSTVTDLAPARVREKVRWVHEAAAKAGRDPATIELNALVFVTAILDDAKPIREMIAKNTGMSPDDVAGCPAFLTGSGAEIRDRLESRREETGISYTVIQGEKMETVERFAEEVVSKLAGR